MASLEFEVAGSLQKKFEEQLPTALILSEEYCYDAV